MHWREQGDRGELSAMEWFASQGATVCVPLGHSPDYDFIADFGDRLERVQVKTSNFVEKGRYRVQTCTRGGNQSWSGTVKSLDAKRFDHLLVVTGDGRRWCIPAGEVDGHGSVAVGGPKYERFEVTPGVPVAGRLLAARRDVRVVKGGGL